MLQQADEHAGCLRPGRYINSLLLSLQRRQGSSHPIYSYHGSRIQAPWHLLLRCAPMYE